MTDSLLSLADIVDVPLSLVGGKAQTLGRLMRAGFDVPQGWSVPVGTPEEALVDVKKGSDRFAVRSSGVAEDGADESLAGRYLSMLYVAPGSVSGAVDKVRAHAMDRDGEQIPVLIQTMIEAKCAGVAFSADPITGNRDTTIVTGVSGLADRLVSGEMTGDEWVIDGRRVRPRRRPYGVVSRRLAVRVARLTERIAEELGGPQDVEWAWDGRRVWVVQARPITSLPPDVDWTPPTSGIYNRSLRFGEWLPEPITPLCESWLLTKMERQVHGYLREIIGQTAPEPHHVVVNGWYFYSLNWLPVPGIAFWRNFIRLVPTLPKNWRNVAGILPITVRFVGRRFEDQWRQEILPAYSRLVSEVEARVDGLDSHDLVETIDGLAEAAGRYFGSITVVAGSAYKFETQLAQFWNKHLRDDLDVSHMVVLQGFEQAEVIGQTPRLESLDWSVSVMPPAPPPLSLEPLRLQRQAVERRANSLLDSSPRKLAKYRRLLADAQHHMPLREEQISQLGIAWPVMRRAITRLGETLVRRGVIESVDDVFYLNKEELVSVLQVPADMRATVLERRADRDVASKLVPPLTVGRMPRFANFIFSMTATIQGATRDPSAVLHGTPASPGKATGKVRVIHNTSQFGSLQPGEVLVAPLTAPAWTDLFSKAAGVVTDVGSAFAHASIIAREYGIPAVVGCGDATSRLRDGQMVTVDGSTGNVTRIFSHL